LISISAITTTRKVYKQNILSVKKMSLGWAYNTGTYVYSFFLYVSLGFSDKTLIDCLLPN